MLTVSKEEFNRLDNDLRSSKPKLSLVFRSCVVCDKKMQIGYYADVGIVTKVLCPACSPRGRIEVTFSTEALLHEIFESMKGATYAP